MRKGAGDLPRVALVTTDAQYLYGGDPDLAPIVAALADRRVEATSPRWRDDGVEWGAFDLVVLRSPWDYSLCPGEFRRWLDRVEQVAVVHNPPDVVRWNMDKHYLADLAAVGVATVETLYADSPEAVDEALARFGSGEVVVKPTISAGARDTGRFRAGDGRVGVLARRILGAGKVVMVQPALPALAEQGELALIYFGGVFSHAVRKGPILAPDGALVGGSYRERLAVADAPAAARHVGEQVLQAVAELGATHHRGRAWTPLLYARVDVVDDDGVARVLEAELMEPSYFLDHAPGAAERFSDVVVRYLSETKLS